MGAQQAYSRVLLWFHGALKSLDRLYPWLDHVRLSPWRNAYYPPQQTWSTHNLLHNPTVPVWGDYITDNGHYITDQTSYITAII